MVYRAHVGLVYNQTGQQVEFYPPTDEVLALGAPVSAATYKVWAGTQANDTTPMLTGTATLDSVSTTTQSIAGPDASGNRAVVQLTSVTGVVISRRYLMTNVASNGSQRMVVVPVSMAGNFVTHQNDIATDFDPLSTFAGLRQVFTIDSTFIQTSSNINVYGGVNAFGGVNGKALLIDSGDTDTTAPPYRVQWTYSIGGLTKQHWTTFDVCRSPLKHNVSVDHVKASMPDIVWLEWVQQAGADFQPQIDEAFQRVIYDVVMAGYDPNMITDPRVVDRLVTLASRAVIATALEKDPDGKIEANYKNAFEKAIGTGLHTWIAVDGSGATAVTPARQLWLSR